MTMITPSYLGETIEYSSLHACRSTLEDPTLLAPDERIKVHALAAALRAVVGSTEPHGALALALVGAEMAVTP